MTDPRADALCASIEAAMATAIADGLLPADMLREVANTIGAHFGRHFEQEEDYLRTMLWFGYHTNQAARLAFNLHRPAGHA